MAKKMLPDTIPPVVVGGPTWSGNAPPTAVEEKPITNDLILSLDALCFCGRRMAHKEGDRTWKCIRLHTGEEPTKRCQSGIPMDDIRSVHQPRPKTEAERDMEGADDE